MGSGCCSGAGDGYGANSDPDDTIASARRHNCQDENHKRPGVVEAESEDSAGSCGCEHDCSNDDASCHSSSMSKKPCTEEADCCEDDSCGDKDSATLVCCDSDDERCDEKCIIAAAALECEKSCEADLGSQGGSASHDHDHDADGHHQSSACASHLAKAFDQYAAYLKSARCICRSILEQGWATTCCAEKSAKVAYKTSQSHACSASHNCKPQDRNSRQRRNHCHDEKARHQQHESGKPEIDDVCTTDEIEIVPHVDKQVLPRLNLTRSDVEKAVDHEYVALSVEGMTCSGCGNKMERTLKAISGVLSVRVNFVMGRAEFTLNTAVKSADEVIREVEKATNFRCSRMACDDQFLDVLASGSSARALLAITNPGVKETAILNKTTVRLTYDPITIGARTLFNNVRDLSTGLTSHQSDQSVSSGRRRLLDQLIKTILAAAFTIPVVVLAWGENVVEVRTKSIVSLVLATIVQLIAVPDFYRPAIGALIHSGTIEMDMLVVVSITAAYVYSVVAFGFRMAGKPLEVSEFFETSTLLVTLVILGRFIAAFARIRAIEAVSMRSLQPTRAMIVENDQDEEIDARLLQYGDTLKILPHSVVATDGIVTFGTSEVDESMLTGESVPVFKKEGDPVIAGTVNGSGNLLAKLTRLPGKNTVTDIAKLVEEAQNSKPKLQDYADKVASWFVPIVTAVAVVVTIVWLVVGFKVRDYSVGQSVSNSITYAVATLAVSCPCALGLAVPMVLVIAGGIAARNGVIIKSAECTERARKVTDVVFDKTGTITEDLLNVTEEKFLIDRKEGISITKSLVAGNKHPVSVAVARHLANESVAAAHMTAVHVIPGAGVEASYNGSNIRAGNPEWTGTASDAVVSILRDNGMTLLVVACDGAPIAVYGLRATLRPEATQVVAELTRRQIAVHIVSGDQKRAVETVALQVGVSHFASQCTPTEKRDYVANLMSKGRNVMFVGDGTNDAVAVTQADVGVQLGSVLSASDVTRGAADVVLLNGLEGIPFLLDISLVSFHRMVFNFAWSAVYNVLAILLASGAFVDVRIPPAYAGLGEIVSVVPVILAALTMLLNKAKISST